jgi:hypothetical protein
MTGLTDAQLTTLVARVHQGVGGELTSRGRPYVLGLFRSVAMVVAVLRKNLTQEFAGAVFGVSQPTVSRRWDLLRPVIGEALAEFVPDSKQVAGAGVCWSTARSVPRGTGGASRICSPVRPGTAG